MSEMNTPPTQNDPSLLPPADPPPAAAPTGPPEFLKPVLDGFSPEERERLTKNDRLMRMKDMKDFIQSWDNSQSTIGKMKAGQFVERPSKTSTAEQWAEFYKAGGRPETPAEYEITVPEGADPEKIKELYPKFHEWGLSSKQAQEAVAYMTQAGLSAQRALASQSEEQSRARRNEVLDKMKLAYGGNYEHYVSFAQGEVAKAVKDDPAMTEELRARYERDPVVLKLVVDLTKHNAPDRLRLPQTGNAGLDHKTTVEGLERQLSDLRAEIGGKGLGASHYLRDPRVVKIKEQIRAAKSGASA